MRGGVILKRIDARVVVILLISIVAFVIAFMVTDKKSYEYTSSYQEEPRVYVTKTGECYHHISCRYLYNSIIEKGLMQAQSQGYVACSRCGGEAFGEIRVEYREYYSVIDYSRAITNGIIYMVIMAVVAIIIISIIECEQERQNSGFEKNILSPDDEKPSGA